MNRAVNLPPILTFLVVDDHESVLEGTVSTLRREYPTAAIQTALDAQSALTLLKQRQPDLLVIDLSIPELPKGESRPETGLQLLRSLMQHYSTLNIVVQSAHATVLVRLKPTISSHEGGFTIADKTASLKEMLTKVEWALKGVIYMPREMRSGLEVKAEWLEVLRLAFREGLTDKAIAIRMRVAERTVRGYWSGVQNALGVYPEEGKNMRIQTEMLARQAGLID